MRKTHLATFSDIKHVKSVFGKSVKKFQFFFLWVDRHWQPTVLRNRKLQKNWTYFSTHFKLRKEDIGLEQNEYPQPGSGKMV